MIHSSSLPLFADIGQYNTLEETKTIMSAGEAEDYLLSLGSLLDRGNAETATFNQYRIEAIPFKGEYCSGEVSLTSQDLENPVADSLTCSKIFYVSTLDTETDTTDLMVVTMVPDLSYLSEHGVSGIEYLEKPNYSGLILYSDLDGTFREACYFKNGQIFPAWPVEDGADVQGNANIHYLTAYQRIETKARDGLGLLRKLLRIVMLGGEDGYYGGELDDAYCYGSYPETLTGTSEKIKGTGGGRGDGWCGGRCGGTSSGNNSKKIPQQEKSIYKVNLTAQMDASGVLLGTVTGSGQYTADSFVYCSATAKTNYCFDGWTGNMPGTGPWVSFKITNNVKATAMFCLTLEKPTQHPCWDYETNIANPLVDMRIAPTDNGLLDNGVFHSYTPYRNAGKHQGIDLAAEVGTPIYAPCDGVISKNSAFVTEQPQRSSREWPGGYTGDTDPAGNRFYLDCTLSSGEKITYAFWHLQAGTPVAINPRTGKTFARGDAVYQGDIIGYVGRTGNAYNIQNTHLHLGVRNSSGKWIDPEPYLNGSVQRDGKKVTSAKFEKVDCDDKSWLDVSQFTTSSGMYQ